MVSKAAKRRGLLLKGAIGIGVLGLVVAVALMIKSFLDAPPLKKQNVQNIAVLRPPPPPPPPKKEEEPPPEVKKEEIKIDEPEPTDEPPKETESDQPEGKDLGVDAEGTGAGDGFGLIGRKGGRDLTAGGSRFGYYKGLLQREIYDVLAKDKKLRGQEFRILVNLWLKPDGTVARVELAESSGKSETDEIIRVALNEVSRVTQAPPEDMPQPMRLRITNRL